MNLETFLIIATVLLVILCACAVFLVIRLLKTLNHVNLSLQILNQNLPGILKNMEAITTNVNSVTGQVNRQVEGFALPALRLQTLLLNSVLGLESALQTGISKFPLFKAARKAPAVIKGLQAFFRTLRGKE